MITAAFMFAACGEATPETVADTNEETTVSTEGSEEEPPVATFPADSVSEDGTGFYGMRVKDGDDFVPASSLGQIVAEANGEAIVRVTGAVESVCKVKGCWMTMDLNETDKMRVRFQDYGFFVPKDCEGKVAYMEGTAFYDTTSVDDLRHYAVDGGMSEEEAAKTINDPEIAISFLATGVMLK